VYMVFSTYQTEFKAKSTTETRASYQALMRSQAMPTMNYLTKSFKTMQFDSTTYTDEQWWKLSGIAVDQLRGLQSQIWNTINLKLTTIRDNIHRNQSILLCCCFCRWL